ncbi:helix-turn-helix domain-containing protein [Glutamicibacter arilaitensis]|uniref:helix-turn-helix domain-containing protein n=1 Tax=Glutamicibacter arilaitensis TaxID=256701 RepID=UPI003850794E
MSMTAAEFTVIRRLIGLSAQDVAEHIGVQLRSAQRWERGERPINEGVESEMRALKAEHDLATQRLQDAPQGEFVKIPTGDNERPRGWWLAAASRVLSSNPEARFDWAE